MTLFLEKADLINRIPYDLPYTPWECWTWVHSDSSVAYRYTNGITGKFI